MSLSLALPECRVLFKRTEDVSRVHSIVGFGAVDVFFTFLTLASLESLRSIGRVFDSDERNKIMKVRGSLDMSPLQMFESCVRCVRFR